MKNLTVPKSKPLIEDRASEHSKASVSLRLLQSCKACSTVSLTGLTYMIKWVDLE